MSDDAMKNLQNLHYTQDEAGVGVLAMARPPVNALGREMVAELRATFDALAGDSSVRALVLTGEGRTFCAGADLKERQTMSEDEVRAFVRSLSDTFQALAELPVPTVAAINGTAAGGGCELVLACDFRVLDSAGRIGLPETTLAIVPGAGGTQRLPRLIGPSRAKRWIFSGRLYTAKEALADGAVDLLAPADKVRDAAVEFVTEMASSGPLAVRAAKSAVDAALSVPLLEGLEIEWRAYETILDTEDRLEALAAFKEKRSPVFKGR